MGGNESRFGYRIIDIFPGSPGEKSGLQIYLDFIISINGTELLKSELPFQELIKNNENCCVTLEVLSLKNMETREVKLTPKVWEGDGLIGVNLSYEDSIEVMKNIIHVTNVFPDTPASNSGLKEGEFIIGCKESKIRTADDIQAILDKNGEINLVVYSKFDKKVRNVLLESIDGSIGIEIATGVMHRINDE